WDTTATLVVTISTNPSMPYNIGTPNQAVITIKETDIPPANAPDTGCGCGAAANLIGTNSNVSANVPAAMSSNTDVVFATGALNVTQSTLNSSDNGSDFGFDWNWSNNLGSGASTLAGNNTVIAELPYLLTDSGGDIEVVSNGDSARI